MTGSPRDDDAPATALLVRPDGYVAWASSVPTLDEHERTALRRAAHRWFRVGDTVLSSPAHR